MPPNFNGNFNSISSRKSLAFYYMAMQRDICTVCIQGKVRTHKMICLDNTFNLIWAGILSEESWAGMNKV
jgi:hypothetical protein